MEPLLSPSVSLSPALIHTVRELYGRLVQDRHHKPLRRFVSTEFGRGGLLKCYGRYTVEDFRHHDQDGANRFCHDFDNGPSIAYY
jgi:hypothetical protein